MTDSNKENAIPILPSVAISLTQQENELFQTRLSPEEIISETVLYMSRFNEEIAISDKEKARMRNLNQHTRYNMSIDTDEINNVKLSLMKYESMSDKMTKYLSSSNRGLETEMLKEIYNDIHRDNEYSYSLKIGETVFYHEKDVNNNEYKLKKVSHDNPDIQYQIEVEDDIDDVILFSSSTLN